MDEKDVELMEWMQNKWNGCIMDRMDIERMEKMLDGWKECRMNKCRMDGKDVE